METSTSPSKNVLYNPDLLGIICWFLKDIKFLPFGTLGTNGNSLCALALTCHATCDTALDCLWHDISGMEPLLSIFPRAISPSSNLPWIPPDPISDEIWARFDRYSNRIRSFTLTASLGALYSPTVPLRLAERQEPLLPKLQKLRVEGFADPSMLLPFLSSPLLDEVVIVFPSDIEADMASMSIWTVGWKVPGLRSLTVEQHFPSFPDDSISVISNGGFSNLRQLRRLNIETCPVDLTFLVQLSSSPHLAELQVLVLQPGVGRPQRRLTQIAFPSLKSLQVAACASLMPSILRLIRQGSLTHLVYQNFPPASFGEDILGLAEFVPAFHAEIASRFPSLISLTLDHSLHLALEDSEELCELSRVSMHPLYDLSKLQTMIYYGMLCVDNDAVDFATSWPEIRSLFICRLHATSPTYGILAVLAKHCPLLTDLSIPITFPPKDVPLRDDGVFSHKLRIFHAFLEPIDCNASIAHYLDRMFPFLVSIEGGVGWDQVRSIILDACQPARRDQLQRLRE
ncbi:hypothetical protein IW261DRAFT_1407832, partial [Armillaria novae-zelandiae]